MLYYLLNIGKLTPLTINSTSFDFVATMGEGRVNSLARFPEYDLYIKDFLMMVHIYIYSFYKNQH